DPAPVQLPDGPAGDPGAHPAEALPAPAGGADPLPVAAGLDPADQPLGPDPVHLHLRGASRLAVAGLLRGLARDRRVAFAGSQVIRGEGPGARGRNAPLLLAPCPSPLAPDSH